MDNQSTILIVDDLPEARRLLARLLSDDDYRLVLAANGAEALQKATTLTPDMILLDVMMPEIDGFEICRRLRADPRLADVPIIMVTALDDKKSRLRGIEAGADDFITKPFDPDELQARVRTTTRLNRYRRLLLERTKFEWVMERSEDGYLIVDTQGNIGYANPQARLYLDLPTSEEAPLTQTFQELTQNMYNREPQQAWAGWPGSLDTQRYLVRPESPAAAAFWLKVDILNLPSVPDTEWVIRMQDVTEQLSRQRDMRSFHAMLNHKLRTPISQMLGSLELLVDLVEDVPRKELVGLARTALNGVQRLNTQINDIFDYMDISHLARPGDGLPVSKLSSLVTQVSANLKLAKSVSVSDCEDAGSAQILLSQQAIELMMWEILENAIKFHPQQSPQVEIAISCPKANVVTIRIYDDGLTLTPSQLAQMWDPYYQGEKNFTGEVIGMGLGLPAVFLIANSAGGTCRAHNREEGSGMVVELVLPCSS